MTTLCLMVKSGEDAGRTIEGIANTGETDTMGDEVCPRGVRLPAMPMSLRWQHDSKAPVGHITHANVSDHSITVRGRIVRIDEPGPLADTCNTAWLAVKHGLARGLSIGFRPLRYEPTETGLRFLEWSLLEVSIVTIAANPSCTISAVTGR